MKRISLEVYKTNEESEFRTRGVVIAALGAVTVSAGAVALFLFHRRNKQLRKLERQRMLRDNLELFSEKEVALVNSLVEEDQEHIFNHWPERGTDDEKKQQQVSQLVQLDGSYPGGLLTYLRNAKRLLKDSLEGRNPFDGFRPEVPEGVRLDFGSPAFRTFESSGLKEAASSAFVLVAGGLGERLGYSGIKLALPTEAASGTCFIELYCKSLLAIQKASDAAAAGASGRQLVPLVIMTSDDTHARTDALLQRNAFFGLSREQVLLLKQEKVACLSDSAAHLALDSKDPYTLPTKPHGHGDVHALLHASGLVEQWRARGINWVCFFQDTNALLFHSLLAALGVSEARGWHVNSLAVPRRAKEAIGGICRLVKKASGEGPEEQLTLNVEYNQLEPLLREAGWEHGDVDDETGYSPFPGNINQLVLRLGEYAAALARSCGVVGEFANPKYEDATRTGFRSSARLECMMQDVPKAYPSDAEIGFTVVNQVWSSYSPVKNSAAEARQKSIAGGPTHSATSAEMDLYKTQCASLVAAAGAHLLLPAAAAAADLSVNGSGSGDDNEGVDADAPSAAVVVSEDGVNGDAAVAVEGGVVFLPAAPTAVFNGIAVERYPAVVLSPGFALTLDQLQAKVRHGSVTLHANASLVIDGADVTIEGPLEVRGALVIRAAPGAHVVVHGLEISNAGWSWEPLEGEQLDTASEEERMRGFRVVRRETEEHVFSETGEYVLGVAAPDSHKRKRAGLGDDDAEVSEMESKDAKIAESKDKDAKEQEREREAEDEAAQRDERQLVEDAFTATLFSF